MSQQIGKNIVTDGLAFSIDAQNKQSFSSTRSAVFSSSWLDSNSNDFDFGDQDFSFGGVFKWNSVSAGRPINNWSSSGNYSYLLRTTGSGVLTFNVSSNGTTVTGTVSGLTIASGVWYHIICVHDSVNDELRMYINGVLYGSAVSYSSGIFSPPAGKFNLGISDGVFFNGQIDTAFVYSKAVNDSEALKIYKGGYQNIDQVDLVSFYKMNEKSGTRFDSFGANHLIQSNVVGFSDGITLDFDKSLYINSIIKPSQNGDFIGNSFNNGTSYEFDGVGDYLDFGTTNDFNFGDGVSDVPFSVSSWIKMIDATRFRIADKKNEWLFTTSGSDQILLLLMDGSTSNRISRISTNSLNENEWTHIVATYNGNGLNSGIKIYINGVESGAYSTADSGSYTSMQDLGLNLFVGYDDDNGNFSSNGQISSTKIYNKELTAEEAVQNYEANKYKFQ